MAKKIQMALKGSPRQEELGKKLTMGKAVPIRKCLDEMKLGWSCKLWLSLAEGANALMDWRCARKLGEGAFGEAFLVFNRHSGERRASVARTKRGSSPNVSAACTMW